MSKSPVQLQLVNHYAMWCVERIVCGDGSQDKSGLRLEKNHFYGCASRFGGNESFHPINFESLKLYETMINLPFCDNFIQKRKPRQNLHPRKVNLKKSLKDWCTQNSGKTVDISGPGHRGRIKGERQFQERNHGPLLMAANNGNCAIAALVNGIDVLLGRDKARDAMTKWIDECPRLRGLKDVARLLHRLSFSLTVQKIPKVEMKAFLQDAFAWLANRKSDVWIVRVVENNMVDHVVAIDGSRKLVLDSASRYPFHLRLELLKQLGGSDARALKVVEVRKLLLQQVNPRKRRRV